MDLRRKEHHTTHKTWQSLALGIGIGAAGVTLARQFRGNPSWFSHVTLPDHPATRWLRDKVSDMPTPDKLWHKENRQPTTDWAPPATAAPIKITDSTDLDAGRYAHAFPTATAPMPELPDDDVFPADDMATQRMDQMGIADDEPIEDEEIRTLAWETLRDNPEATYDEVLAAWRVHRGETVDADEAARVAAVYGQMHEAFNAA